MNNLLTIIIVFNFSWLLSMSIVYVRRHGAVASASGYESVGPSSIPDEDGVDPTQVFILHWSINGYLGQPREGKLWKPGFHAGPMSRGKGLFHHSLKGQGDGR